MRNESEAVLSIGLRSINPQRRLGRGRSQSAMNNVRRMGAIRAAFLSCGAALLCSAGSALATEPPHDSRPPPTREMREKMAEAHEKIAACLRSDRPIDECHAEMMKMHEAMKHEHAKMDHPAPESTPK